MEKMEIIALQSVVRLLHNPIVLRTKVSIYTYRESACAVNHRHDACMSVAAVHFRPELLPMRSV